MKSFIKLFLAALLTLSVAMFLGACGDDNNDTAAKSYQDDTSTASTQKASGANQSASMANNSTSTFQDLGSLGLSSTTGAPKLKTVKGLGKSGGTGLTSKLAAKFAKSNAAKKAAAAVKKAKMNATYSGTGGLYYCDDGGSFTVSGGGLSWGITFDMCKEYGEQYNGVYQIAINSAGDTITFSIGSLATPFEITTFDNGYATMVAKMSADIDLVYSFTTNSTTSAAFTMEADGTISAYDYISSTEFNITYTNFIDTITATYNTDNDVYTIEADGGIYESWSEAGNNFSIGLTFTNFTIGLTWYHATYDESYTIDGGVTINFEPNTACVVDGSWTFDTTTPIYYDYAMGHTMAGVLVISDGTNTITITYNSDGSVTVSDSTGTVNYSSEYAMYVQCDFETGGGEAPAEQGTTGTTEGAQSMYVTSYSYDQTTGNLDCYTDLHVNYYDTTAPTSSTMGAWYVDWHQSDYCTSPDINGDGDSTNDFQQALSIDGDTTCDVGLDIDGAWLDSELAGTEHYIGLQMPVGYYVVSMNNWSCDSTVQHDVSIQINNDVYGVWTSSFTTADYEGQTAGAWYAVADIRVNEDGSANVIAHNGSLELWHDAAFGMAAPAFKARGVK